MKNSGEIWRKLLHIENCRDLALKVEIFTFTYLMGRFSSDITLISCRGTVICRKHKKPRLKWCVKNN